MYLYYYLNEKYVGTVDIEAFFDLRDTKSLVYCTEECDLLLGGLELAYGKTIPRFCRAEAFKLNTYNPSGNPHTYSRLPGHVFTTKYCGKVLAWSDYEMALACRL